jgi:hypothetical protein
VKPVVALYLLSLPMLLAVLLGAQTAPCGVDRYEPNDKPQRARRLGGQPVAGMVCPGDDDWFRLRLPARVGVEITLRTETDVPMEPLLVYPPGRRHAPIGHPYSAPGEIGTRFVTPRAGPYRIRVRGGATWGTPYRLRFWTEDP